MLCVFYYNNYNNKKTSLKREIELPGHLLGWENIIKSF